MTTSPAVQIISRNCYGDTGCFRDPKSRLFPLNFLPSSPALFSHVPLLSSCAASLGADTTALLPSAQHGSAKNLNCLSVTFLLASDSRAGLSLLNLLLGNDKLECETPSISIRGEKKATEKGKDTLLGSLLASSKAPTRNRGRFAISVLLPTDLAFRSVWVVFL